MRSDSTTRLWPALQPATHTHKHSHTCPPCGERGDWEKIDLPPCGVLRGLKPLRMYFLCSRLKRPPTLEIFYFRGRSETSCPCLILQTLRALIWCRGKIQRARFASSDTFHQNVDDSASLQILIYLEVLFRAYLTHFIIIVFTLTSIRWRYKWAKHSKLSVLANS